MNIENIVAEVKNNLQISGLSDEDLHLFAQEILKRGIKKAIENVGVHGPSTKMFEGNELTAYRHGWEQAKDSIYGQVF